MYEKPHWSLINNPAAWHTDTWLAFATQEDFFLRIILRRMAHKLRKALGGTYGNCQKVPQRLTKLTEAFKIWMLLHYDQLRFRLVADNSLVNSQNRDAKRFPVADQFRNGEPELFRQVMKTILSLLSCGQRRTTELAQDPIQIFHTDDDAFVGEGPPIENPDNISNPCRKMCNLVLENSSNNSSDSLPELHPFLMLLLCNVLRSFGDFCRALGNFGGSGGYVRCLARNFAGTFRRSPRQHCHRYGCDTDHQSHYYGPSIPPHYAVAYAKLHARADSMPPLLQTAHSLIPLWTGRHSAMTAHCRETAHV